MFASLRHQMPYLLDSGENRSLHFGDYVVQSQMQTDDPLRLDLEYTRMMMSFLLFAAQPRRIAMIGLGGGSLAKFCLHHLPRCTVLVAEINPLVLRLRSEFAIPADDHRFAVLLADGAEFIRDRRGFDVILVDGYDHEGLPPSLSNPGFYQNCARALKPEGLALFNLLPVTRTYVQHLDQLTDAFAHTRLAQDDEGFNSVLVASRRTLPVLPFEIPADWAGATELKSTFNRLRGQWDQQLAAPLLPA